MDLVRKCYHDTTADGWKDRAGRPIVNWKAWLRKWTEAELRRGTMKQGQSRRVGGPVDVSDDSTDVFVLEARKQAGEVAP
ncbi:MAG TPA: hypothetical protein DCM68_05105 [Verrucomicrobia bacterium]|nr:hypothetical protein [Verrucomicrobiota bacterium]